MSKPAPYRTLENPPEGLAPLPGRCASSSHATCGQFVYCTEPGGHAGDHRNRDWGPVWGSIAPSSEEAEPIKSLHLRDWAFPREAERDMHNLGEGLPPAPSNVSRTYLGDSVYAAIENGAVALTTENGAGPTNRIVLEEEVLLAFGAWLKRLGCEP